MRKVSKQIEKAIEQLLRERLQGISFSAIYVTLEEDEYGDEYLLVDVVVDDKKEWPEARKTASLVRHMRPKLEAVGTEAFPILSFYAASELEKAAREDFRSYMYGDRLSA